ncbi:MAG TPA: M1 family metallopeptidase [Rhizomicrobium sp.]
MSRYLLPAALLIATLSLSGCDKPAANTHAQAAPTAAPATAEASDAGPVPLAQLPRVAVPSHYRIALTIDPTKDNFSGHDEIDINVTKPLHALYIDGNQIDMKTAVVKAGGKTIAANYKQVDKSGVALLTFASTVPAGAATLVFDYDAPFNQSLAGLYKVTVRGDAYAFTQFEDIDARRMFPSFDEPGFKTPFDITVTAPQADKIVGNTPVTTDVSVGNGMMRATFETTKPLPTYLVALAIGPLDIVNEGDIPPNQYRHYPLPLRGIAARGMGPKLQYAMSLTPAVITALENYYQLPYPFQKVDILAVPDFSAGAMENAGAVTFREELLLMGNNAPMDQKRISLDVQAHELAHQWFGDFVTPSWWDNIWLNESFATWMQSKISNMVRPDEEFGRATEQAGLGVMRLDELPSARQIHNPVNNPDDIANAFDQITYSKGGAVLAMFEAYVGPAEWQKGIHAYLTKYAYSNATAQDFITTIAQATNHPEIVDAFNNFIDQPGIPQINPTLACSAGSAAANVTEAQYTPVGIQTPGHTWKVPACLEADSSRVCQLVTPPSTTVPLGSTCPKVLFPNAQGSGYYRYGTDEKGWANFIAAAPTLDPAEQLSLYYNTDAAVRADQAQASDLFAMIHALAPVAQWDVVSAINATLHDLRVTGVIAPSDVPALQALVRSEFGPRLAPLGLASKPGESVANALLRENLVTLLVEEGRDPALMAKLTTAAQTFVSSGGKNTGGIAPELAAEAMRAGAISGGATFANSLFDLLQKSDDEFLQMRVVEALAASEDPATLQKLAGMALSPSVRIGDIRFIFASLPQSDKGRTVLWSWLKTNLKAVENRVSLQGLSRAPEIQQYACDTATKSDLDAFFDPLTSQLEGLPRELKEANDQIDRCIAFKNAKAPQIAAALKVAK